MKHGSLFAGIGGFDLGFERAGIETVWTVENDENCNRVLAAHWPDVKRYGDVKEVGSHNLSSVDIISGGFPCQDLSVAGRRAGLAGERSGVWFEFARIVEEMAPQWVVVENVPGLFSSDQGEDFLAIVEALDKLRYGVSWRVFDSRYFDVAQRRERVFIVGSLGDMRSAEILFESEGCQRNPAEGREEGEGVAAPLKGSPPSRRNAGSWPTEGELIVFNWQSGGDVRLGISSVHTNALHSSQVPALAMSENQRAEVRLTPYSRQLTSGGGKAGQGYGAVMVALTLSAKNEVASSSTQRAAWYRQSAELFGIVRRLTPTEYERLQGFPDGWTEGLSDSARYRCLGNAVTVNVAEWIGKRLGGAMR